jgi:hypothetical protein
MSEVCPPGVFWSDGSGVESNLILVHEFRSYNYVQFLPRLVNQA